MAGHIYTNKFPVWTYTIEMDPKFLLFISTIIFIVSKVFSRKNKKYEWEIRIWSSYLAGEVSSNIYNVHKGFFLLCFTYLVALLHSFCYVLFTSMCLMCAIYSLKYLLIMLLPSNSTNKPKRDLQWTAWFSCLTMHAKLP